MENEFRAMIIQKSSAGILNKNKCIGCVFHSLNNYEDRGCLKVIKLLGFDDVECSGKHYYSLD